MNSIQRINEMNVAAAAHSSVTDGDEVTHTWSWGHDRTFTLRVTGGDLDGAVLKSTELMIPMIIGGFGSGSVAMMNGSTTRQGVDYPYMKDIRDEYPEVYEWIRQLYEHLDLVEYVKAWCVVLGNNPTGFSRMLDLADQLKPYTLIHMGAAFVAVNSGVPLFLLGDTKVETLLEVACVVAANTVATMYNQLDRDTTMACSRKVLLGHPSAKVLDEFGEKILDGFVQMYTAVADVVHKQESAIAVDPTKQQAVKILRAVHDKAISND